MGAYKNKYSKYLALKNSTIAAKSQQVVNDLLLVSNNFSGEILSNLSSFNWQELGQEQLMNSTIPLLAERVKTISSNVENSLVKVCNSAVNELLPKVEAIIKADETLDSDQNRLNSMSDSEKYGYNQETKQRYERQAYISLKQSIATQQSNLSSMDSEIAAIINRINSYTVADIAGTTASGIIPQIAGLELTDQEKWFIEQAVALENNINPTLNPTTKKGSIRLLNDAGGKKLGYSRQILTSHGKAIKVFQQAWNEPLKLPIGTLRSGGCGWNALASILSSVDPKITPEKVFTKMGTTFMYANDIINYCESEYGLKVGSRKEVPRKDYQAYRAKIVQELQRGNMIMFTVNNRTNDYFTKSGHWLAAVDIDKNGNIYLTDSNDRSDKHSGAYNLDDFLKKYSVNSNIIYLNDDRGYGKYPDNYQKT